MHPRALVYHAARTDFHCLPLYHELIGQDARAQRTPPSDLFRDDPGQKSEQDIRGARNILSGVLIDSLIASKVAAVRGIDPDSDEATTYGQKFEWLLDDLRSYRENGENIFHIQPAIIDLFRHSDLGDAEFDRLKFPFERFYLHFGEAAGVAVGPDHYWDGAYVVVSDLGRPGGPPEEGVFVSLVTRGRNTRYENRRGAIEYLLGDPVCSPQLWFVDTRSIARAIDKAVEEVPEDDDYRYIPQQRELWSPTAVRDALHFVANALLFLASEHSEVTHRYPHDAPENLVRKEEHGDGENQRERASSKLWSLGFKKVHFVGDNIERDALSARARGELVDAHWRRGHWRNQPHGVGNTLRKLLWIRPTIVRPDLGEPHPRRVYGVPE